MTARVVDIHDYLSAAEPVRRDEPAVVVVLPVVRRRPLLRRRRAKQEVRKVEDDRPCDS